MAEEEKVTTPSCVPTVLDEESSLETCARLESLISPDTSQTNSCTTTAYPDGSLRANLTVLGAFIALFCTFGQMNAFGTFQAWYTEHQLAGLPASTISWIGSLQLWIFFFSVCRYQFLPILLISLKQFRAVQSVVFLTPTVQHG